MGEEERNVQDKEHSIASDLKKLNETTAGPRLYEQIDYQAHGTAHSTADVLRDSNLQQSALKNNQVPTVLWPGNTSILSALHLLPPETRMVLLLDQSKGNLEWVKYALFYLKLPTIHNTKDFRQEIYSAANPLFTKAGKNIDLNIGLQTEQDIWGDEHYLASDDSFRISQERAKNLTFAPIWGDVLSEKFLTSLTILDNYGARITIANLGNLRRTFNEGEIPDKLNNYLRNISNIIHFKNNPLNGSTLFTSEVPFSVQYAGSSTLITKRFSQGVDDFLKNQPFFYRTEDPEFHPYGKEK